MKPSLLVAKSAPNRQTQIPLGSSVVGSSELVVIAGPCTIESYTQARLVADTLVANGISCMRGGIFKPRTSPYSFQGLHEEGFEIIQAIRRETGLAIVSEVMSLEQLELAVDQFDCIQIGSRNMQNFELLKALGKINRPVLLKRGLAATIEEFLLAAEYILASGNPNVILCERGIRSFDPATRNVLDLASVALLKEQTHLPVIVDPSHATGKRSLILPTSRAAVAVGADGLIVEIHPVPEQSVSDADQAISLEDFTRLLTQIEPVASAVGRTMFECVAL